MGLTKVIHITLIRLEKNHSKLKNNLGSICNLGSTMNITFSSVSSHAGEILTDEQGNLFAKHKEYGIVLRLE